MTPDLDELAIQLKRSLIDRSIGNVCDILHKKLGQKSMVCGRRLTTDPYRKGRILPRHITEVFGHEGTFRG